MILALLMLVVLSACPQCLDSVGLDDERALNRCEAKVLDRLGGSWPHCRPEEVPTVVFCRGNTAVTIPKSDFFHNEALPWLRKGDRPALAWHILSAADRKRTGVDALVVAWSKVGFTKRARRRVVEQLELERGGKVR